MDANSSTGLYGPGSAHRYADLRAVSEAAGDAETAIKAAIYLNNSTAVWAESDVFKSSTHPGPWSRYSFAHDTRPDMNVSRNDAEVKALDWAYETLRKEQVLPREVVVDLAVSMGTCNGCKIRQKALADDLMRAFPGTRVDVKVNANYYSSAPAFPARGYSTAYGFKDAKPMKSAAADGAGGDLYWQYSQRGGASGTGSTSAAQAARTTAPGASAPRSSDANSPHITPSPPSNSPTAASALKNAQTNAQKADNDVSMWEIGVQNATTKLNTAKQAHRQVYNQMHPQISRFNRPQQGEHPEVYRSRIDSLTNDQRQVAPFAAEVARAKNFLTGRQSGLESARQVRTAASQELEKAKAAFEAATRAGSAARPTATRYTGTSSTAGRGGGTLRS